MQHNTRYTVKYCDVIMASQLCTYINLLYILSSLLVDTELMEKTCAMKLL